MTALKQYILSIVCAAVICAVITGITKESGHSRILKLVCGIFLALQIIRPLPGISKLSLADLEPLCLEDAKALTEEGRRLARQEKEQVIIEETESYILSKAASQDPGFSVEVILSDGEDPIPESVVICGSLTEEEKQNLQKVLEEELAIAKENQIWIGGK